VEISRVIPGSSILHSHHPLRVPEGKSKTKKSLFALKTLSRCTLLTLHCCCKHLAIFSRSASEVRSCKITRPSLARVNCVGGVSSHEDHQHAHSRRLFSPEELLKRQQVKRVEKKISLIASVTKTFSSQGAARKPHPGLNLHTPAIKMYRASSCESAWFLGGCGGVTLK
jgi:hypothetical protein